MESNFYMYTEKLLFTWLLGMVWGCIPLLIQFGEQHKQVGRLLGPFYFGLIQQCTTMAQLTP